MKILLLEDEKMLRSSITEYLDSCGHKVIECSDGKEADEMIQSDKFDLLLLDINVPEKNGFEILETMKREEKHIPTVFISARVDIEDITRGFQLGCADYIKKPFHLKELALRIENMNKMLQEKTQNHVVLSADYSFDIEEDVLYYMGKPGNLTKRQLQIVRVLATNIGSIVDFDKFREKVWNSGFTDNATIRAEVNRLKKALKQDFILNSRGLGYKVQKI